MATSRPDRHGFKPGDTVRLRTGVAHQRVIQTRRTEIMARYINAPDPYPYPAPDWRSAYDYVFVEPGTPLPDPSTFPNNQGKAKMAANTPTLYQIIGSEPPTFGTLLAKDSNGNLVLELRTNPPRVEVFAPDKLEEVRPYTIATAHSIYTVAKDAGLAVGDLLISEDNGIEQVLRIDTKSALGKPFTGRKLVTEPIRA